MPKTHSHMQYSHSGHPSPVCPQLPTFTIPLGCQPHRFTSSGWVVEVEWTKVEGSSSSNKEFADQHRIATLVYQPRCQNWLSSKDIHFSQSCHKFTGTSVQTKYCNILTMSHTTWNYHITSTSIFFSCIPLQNSHSRFPGRGNSPDNPTRTSGDQRTTRILSQSNPHLLVPRGQTEVPHRLGEIWAWWKIMDPSAWQPQPTLHQQRSCSASWKTKTTTQRKTQKELCSQSELFRELTRICTELHFPKCTFAYKHGLQHLHATSTVIFTCVLIKHTWIQSPAQTYKHPHCMFTSQCIRSVLCIHLTYQALYFMFLILTLVRMFSYFWIFALIFDTLHITWLTACPLYLTFAKWFGFVYFCQLLLLKALSTIISVLHDGSYQIWILRIITTRPVRYTAYSVLNCSFT